jgi:adenosine deaminase
MRPSTLLDLSQRYGATPPDPPDGSMETFLRLHRAAASVLRAPDDYVRLVDEVVDDAAADGVVWVEPAEWSALVRPEQVGLPDAESMLQLLLEACRRASVRTGVGVGLMVSSNRTRPPEEAVALAHLAARHAGRGVVSFGLADNELKGRPEPFTEAFAIARSAGLIAAPHGGEHGGPDSVRGALDALGARRVQHGVRSAEDPDLVHRLADEGVCLDVCPTSNVQLSVVESLAAHPLPALLDAGVAVSLNADDPLFFGSGVLAEYEQARAQFGFGDDELARIAACSIRASGAPDTVKAEALVGIEAWLGA